MTWNDIKVSKSAKTWETVFKTLKVNQATLPLWAKSITSTKGEKNTGNKEKKHPNKVELTLAEAFLAEEQELGTFDIFEMFQ